MLASRWVRIGLGVLAALAVLAGGTYLYMKARGNQLLQVVAQRWVSDRFAAASDSVYRAAIHGLEYNPALQAITFDSFTIGTHVIANQARPAPLPTITAAIHGGRVSGIALWNALVTRTVDLREVRTDSVSAIVALPPVFHQDSTASAPRAESSGTRPRGSVLRVGAASTEVARGQPMGRVQRVRLSNISGRLVIPKATGTQEIELQGFAIELDSLSFDPSRTATTPFEAADFRISAQKFSGRVDQHNRLEFARFSASVRDSALSLHGFRIAPAAGDSAFFANHQYRATRTIAAFDSLRIDGLDWGGLAGGSRVAVRRLGVDGLLLDLLVDKRARANPVKKRKPSPQDRLRAVRADLRIDSVLVRGGTVRYAEQVAGAPRPGRLHFDGIDAALTNLTNDPARQTDSTPLRLDARARFMGKGQLRAQMEFPLLSERYDARYWADVGPMPAVALNEVLTPLVGAGIKEGEITRVRLRTTVRNGVYSGVLVPEYANLGVSLPPSAKDRNATGVKGLLKGVARGAKQVAANTVVRDDNPPKPGKPPRSGTVRYARLPTDSFFSGLWKSLKPALAETMAAIKL